MIKKGVSLIKVLIIIIIIGILAVLLFLNIGNIAKDTKASRQSSDLMAVQTASDRYFLENGVFPTINGEIPTGNDILLISFDKLDGEYLNLKEGSLDDVLYYIDKDGSVVIKQREVVSDDLSFGRIQGGEDDDYGYAISPLLDRGYIVVGGTYSSTGDFSTNKGLKDGFIMRFNKDGEKVFVKNVGGSLDDNLKDVIQLSDGNFIAAGISSSMDGDLTSNYGVRDIFVVKFDIEGNILWSKNYGGSSDDGTLASLAEMADGTVLVSGSTFSNDIDFVRNRDDRDGFVLAIDSNGDILWSKTYGETFFYEEIKDIIIAKNGDILLTGDTGFEGFVTRLDSSGNVLWRKEYGGSASDELLNILELEDENILVSGFTYSVYEEMYGYGGNSDAWLMKIDKNGNILWEKTYAIKQYDRNNGLLVDSNGNIIISGYSYIAGSSLLDKDSYVLYALKLDQDGDILWSKLYGGVYDKYSSDVKINSEDNLYFTGTVSLPKSENIFVMKTDKEGNILDNISELSASAETRYTIEEIPLDYEQGTIRLNPDDEDDGIVNVPLNFNISFGGTSYSSLYADTNGRISFSPIESDFSAEYLKNVFVPLIAPYWTDLAFDSSTIPDAGLYYKEGFEDDRNYVVIEYRNVFDYDTDWDVGNEGNFAVKIYEDGDMEFSYKDVYFDGYELNGNDATVGFVIEEDTEYYTYSENTELLRDNLTILFSQY